MKKFILFLAAAVAMVGCNEAIEEVTPSVEAEGVKVSVNLSLNDASTRVDLTDDGAQGYEVTWRKTDKVGAWSQGVYYNNKFTEFKISTYDAQNATFKGTLQNAQFTEKVRFVHPLISACLTETDDNKVYYGFKMDLSSQSINDETNVGDYTYMVSDDIPYRTSTDALTATDVNMKHLGAAMDLNLKLETPSTTATLEKVVISGMPSVATVDLSEADIDACVSVVDPEGDITLTVGSFTAESGIYTVPFSIIPFSLENGMSIDVVATFKDADKYYTAEKTLTNDGSAVDFARATRNTLNVQLGELTEFVPVYEKGSKENPYTTKDEISSNQGKTNVWVKGVIVGTYAGGSTKLITSGFADLNVVLSVENDEKIPVKFVANTDVKTYVNLKDHPENLNQTVLIKGTLGEYYGVYAVETPTEYEFVEDYTVKFTGLNPESLSFASDATTAQEVTIEGSNLDSAESITVTNSNEVDFTVVYTSGTTFTVAPNAANDSDAAYTATVTVTIDGITATIPVSQKPGIEPELATFTLSGGNGISSSASKGIFTDSYVTFEYNDMSYSSGSYTIAKSTNTGYLKNTTALNGIQTIVLYNNENSYNNYTLYAGTDINNVTTEVDYTSAFKYHTYDVAGYTYFKFVNESSYDAYAETIKFNFDIEVSFTALNPESIEFDSTADGLEVVTIEGSNLDSAESITVTNSNETNFTVDYTDGDTEFMVYPTAANESDAAYTATVTVNVDGTEHTLAVSQKYAGQPAESLKIVATDLETTNAKDLGTYTIGDFTLTFTKISGNPPKYYTSDNTLRMYNKNTLKIESSTTDLSKIVFDISKGSISSVDNGNWDSSNKSWTGGTNSVTFTVTTTTSIKSLIIN